MSITNAERDQLLSIMGVGLLPIPGMATGPTNRAPIAQTFPYNLASGTINPTTGIMALAAVYLAAGTVVNQISVATIGAAGTPTHYWHALYDDGRGTATANQLALLGQSTDNTGAIAANTFITAALTAAFTTTYSGLHYVGVMSAATTGATFAGTPAKSSTATVNYGAVSGIVNTGSHLGATAGSALTTTAPNPSGAITATTGQLWALVS